MPNYRRWYCEGGTYFFTVVTAQRFPLFRDPDACRLLGQTIRSVAKAHPFKTIAVVLLPDHLHAIWELPQGDCEFSTRWKLIKSQFLQQWASSGGIEAEPLNTSTHRGSRNIWQRRFWEHLIRDERDLEAHFDYVHFNPVKHQLAASPWDWEWSTFRKYVQAGHYAKNWGSSEPPHIQQLNLD